MAEGLSYGGGDAGGRERRQGGGKGRGDGGGGGCRGGLEVEDGRDLAADVALRGESKSDKGIAASCWSVYYACLHKRAMSCVHSQTLGSLTC